jgi:hypothetical protein
MIAMFFAAVACVGFAYDLPALHVNRTDAPIASGDRCGQHPIAATLRAN